MFLHFSIRTPAVILAGVLYWVSVGYGQTDKSDHGNGATITTVAIDGLVCSSSTQGSFQASDFGIAVSTTSGSGGAGAGKTIFTDLAILKPADGCSLPLFVLAVNGQVMKRVVLTEGGRNGAPDLTTYAAITITDSAGHTTGRVARDSGSVPFSPFVRPRPSSEI